MGVINMVIGTRKPVVLPHGTAHMTPASRAIHALALGTGIGRSSRRKKKGTAAAAARRTRGRRSKVHASTKGRRHTLRRKGRRSARHLVKGSTAARRHMAKLRRMRKKAG